jgi:arylsulfatase A-like enzyme
MRRAVIVVLDGLRRDLIREDRTPNLCALANRAESFARHRSVFVSTTRVASASLATGCHPGRHELQGNEMALMEGGRLVAHDAGDPEFLQHKRRVTGRSLAMPTLAERVKPLGGAMVFSNVSPGAAYAQDPDGHGWVFHRAGSFAPGRVKLTDGRHLGVTPDSKGDTDMTTRFIDEALAPGATALSVLWLGDPDKTQHVSPLGSPQHLEALKTADANAGRAFAAVERMRQAGEEVLLICCSDHGHQTIIGSIDIEAELVAARLKRGAGSDDVISAPNGTAALIYADPAQVKHLDGLHEFLVSRHWAGQAVPADRLGDHGQAPHHGLAFAVSMKATDAENPFGIRGASYVAKPRAGKPDRAGDGQHGGLAAYEQAPFLMIDGDGFAAGGTRQAPSCVVDIAPTVLAHLRLTAMGSDGKSLI